MLKKTVTYTDYDGVERTEDFYFNLTQQELIEWQFSEQGTLEDILTRITKAKNLPAMIAATKDMLLRTYGEKSPDGRHFYKSQAIKDAFENHAAFSEIYMEFANNDEVMHEFIVNIFPASLQAEIRNSQEVKALVEHHPESQKMLESATVNNVN